MLCTSRSEISFCCTLKRSFCRTPMAIFNVDVSIFHSLHDMETICTALISFLFLAGHLLLSAPVACWHYSNNKTVRLVWLLSLSQNNCICAKTAFFANKHCEHNMEVLCALKAAQQSDHRQLLPIIDIHEAFNCQPRNQRSLCSLWMCIFALMPWENHRDSQRPFISFHKSYILLHLWTQSP